MPKAAAEREEDEEGTVLASVKLRLLSTPLRQGRRPAPSQLRRNLIWGKGDPACLELSTWGRGDREEERRRDLVAAQAGLTRFRAKIRFIDVY